MASAIMKLAASGAGLRREIAELGAPLARKLEHKAFVAAALEQAQTNAARVQTLASALAGPDMAESNAVLRRMIGKIREPTTSAPFQHVGGYLTEAAGYELARHGSGPLELFALAATLAAKDYPKDFGTARSRKEHAHALAKLQARLAELHAEIERSWSARDVTMHPVTESERGRGLSRLTLNATGGDVAVGDRLGERLVSWFEARERKRAA